MPGKRKTPKLRFNGSYYVANFYKPDGRRSMISFGPLGEHTEGEIYSAFGKWLDLFNQFPHKVLSYKNPYEAIDHLINPANVISVGQILEQYADWVRKTAPYIGEKRADELISRTSRIKRFLDKYHNWSIEDFGPDELRNVVEAMKEYRYKTGETQAHYTRTGINSNLHHIRLIWDWGIGREYVTHAQAKCLEEVKPLRLGQWYDNNKRAKVTCEEFEKVTQNVNSIVSDMLQLIWYTAMRPGEVCGMRPYDILRDDPKCWIYIPGRQKSPVGEHKTTHFERVKVIPLTTRPQEILKRRIQDWESQEHIFKPVDAISELYQKRAETRKTPLHYGNRPGSNKKDHPMITPGEKYNVNAFRTACKRGCIRAAVELFTPYDLRRTVATSTRAMLGKEAAKLLLGHTKTDTTDIYLLEEVQEAIKVAKLLAAKT